MDTNDYRSDDDRSQYGAGQDYNQQGGVYNSGYYAAQPGSYGRDGGKKSRKAFAFFMAFLMVLCLAAGGVFTAYVIMPGIQPSLPGSEVAAVSPGQNQPEGDNGSPGGLTTQSPEIGGQAPSIDYSQSPIVQIAKEVGPTVVGVAVSAQRPSFGYDSAEEQYGYGSGFIISSDGYIVTNNHVVAGGDTVRVVLFDGKEYQARLVGADATTDLAVIKVEAQGLTPAALGDSERLEVGETVVAIGNPLGSELAGSVTSGIVSALNREISTNGYSQKYIQTDAAINPGNSGGPLVNLKGEVIGINTLKKTLAGFDDYGIPIGTEGIGFAIPVSSAKPIIEQLITKGSVERPGIGITCTVDLTNRYNPAGSPEGVTVITVTADGPADLAGIKPSDIITSIEGIAVKTVEELTGVIQSHKVGEVLNLIVWRAGSDYKARVTVGDLNKMG